MDAKQVGKRIQDARKRLGLTQEQFSQVVDLTPNYLSNIETGFKTPKLETFVEIANALQCDANSLLSDVMNVTIMQESRYIATDLATLPLKEQRKIIRIVEILIEEAKKED